jgi:hypothetical protein
MAFLHVDDACGAGDHADQQQNEPARHAWPAPPGTVGVDDDGSRSSEHCSVWVQA